MSCATQGLQFAYWDLCSVRAWNSCGHIIVFVIAIHIDSTKHHNLDWNFRNAANSLFMPLDKLKQTSIPRLAGIKRHEEYGFLLPHLHTWQLEGREKTRTSVQKCFQVVIWPVLANTFVGNWLRCLCNVIDCRMRVSLSEAPTNHVAQDAP